jgi:hypothetical protein
MHGPNAPYWTLNSCFGALCSVWVDLGSFRYCMKLGANRAKQVQLKKNRALSRVGIFQKERT